MIRKLSPLTALALIVLALVPSICLAQKGFVRLSQDAMVQDITLPKGEYRIDWTEEKDKVTFLQGKKALVSTGCRIEALTESVPGDIVVYARGEDGKARVVRIVLADEKITIHLEN